MSEPSEPERLKIAWESVKRRQPYIDLRYREGLAFIQQQKYTGPFTVHASEGVPKRIVLPNPEGW